MFDKMNKIGKKLTAAAETIGRRVDTVLNVARVPGRWLGKKKRIYARLITPGQGKAIRLFKCPACQVEFQINISGDHIWCGACQKNWKLSGNGSLGVTEGKPEFRKIAAWQDWEQEGICEEIRKGTYRFEDTVRVETMADTGKFVRQGNGRLIQTPEGTRLECRYFGEDYTLIRSARAMESAEVLYNPQGTGDCVELPSPYGCFRCYLSKRNALPKLAFATEEIHRQAVQAFAKK